MTFDIAAVPPVRPPFDPEVGAFLSMLPSIYTTVRADQIIESRALSKARRTEIVDLQRGGAVRVDERTVPGPAGDPDVVLLIMSPTQLSGPRPLVYSIHGGGMIRADRYVGAGQLAEWVEAFNIVAVSVEYRLAPENPHPAPVEDCYAGLVWVAEHADELGVDAERILVHGASAGGGLAAATALLARDRGGPVLSHQMLHCPMLDDRMITHSSQMLEGEGVWDRISNRTGWTALLGESVGGPDVSPYAAPARAQDLSGLPATYLEVGSVEVFRDEVIDYGTRLSQSGVPVEMHVWSGGFHGFDGLVPQAALSRSANQTRMAYLRRILN